MLGIDVPDVPLDRGPTPPRLACDLVDYRFGRANVRRGNKAFDVNENTRRIDADAAPCFAYRLYVNSWQYHEGTALIADDTGGRITNFPQQQYENGVAKNDATWRKSCRFDCRPKACQIRWMVDGA